MRLLTHSVSVMPAPGSRTRRTATAPLLGPLAALAVPGLRQASAGHDLAALAVELSHAALMALQQARGALANPGALREEKRRQAPRLAELGRYAVRH